MRELSKNLWRFIAIYMLELNIITTLNTSTPLTVVIVYSMNRGKNEKYSIPDIIQPNLIPNLTSFKSGSKKMTQQTKYLNSKVLDISSIFLCKN